MVFKWIWINCFVNPVYTVYGAWRSVMFAGSRNAMPLHSFTWSSRKTLVLFTTTLVIHSPFLLSPFFNEGREKGKRKTKAVVKKQCLSARFFRLFVCISCCISFLFVYSYSFLYTFFWHNFVCCKH